LGFKRCLRKEGVTDMVIVTIKSFVFQFYAKN